MRTFISHRGPCEVCGLHVPCGAYWITRYRVLDFGTPHIPPIEPAMNTPRRCDDCEWEVRQKQLQKFLGQS